MTSMSVVRVRSTKWDGTPHRDSPAWELGVDHWGTWLAQASGSTVTTAAGSYLSAAGLRLLRSDQWWSVFYMTDQRHSSFSMVYVDIATPVVRAGQTMMFVDLDLDVCRKRGAGVQILDRDEFETHRVRYRYPDHLVRAAEQSVTEVTTLLARRREPFRYAPQRWMGALTEVLRDPSLAGELI